MILHDSLVSQLNLEQKQIYDVVLQSVYERTHYRKKDLCRVLSILPSVFFGHSAKSIFAECRKQHSAKTSLPSAFFRHSAKSFFAECLFQALGKDNFQIIF
jgi:hypothetical protein